MIIESNLGVRSGRARHFCTKRSFRDSCLLDTMVTMAYKTVQGRLFVALAHNTSHCPFLIKIRKKWRTFFQ